MRFLILMLISNLSIAAPFAACQISPDTIQPTFVGVFIDTLPKVEIPVVKDATGKAFCKYDIGNLTVGQHSVKFAYIVKDPVWGTLESGQSTPFAFSRPTIPTTPVGLGLIP
jgi:hypothetical protein